MPLPRFRIRTLIAFAFIVGCCVAGVEIGARYRIANGENHPYRYGAVIALTFLVFWGFLRFLRRYERLS